MVHNLENAHPTCAVPVLPADFNTSLTSDKQVQYLSRDWQNVALRSQRLTMPTARDESKLKQ